MQHLVVVVVGNDGGQSFLRESISFIVFDKRENVNGSLNQIELMFLLFVLYILAAAVVFICLDSAHTSTMWSWTNDYNKI